MGSDERMQPTGRAGGETTRRSVIRAIAGTASLVLAGGTLGAAAAGRGRASDEPEVCDGYPPPVDPYLPPESDGDGGHVDGNPGDGGDSYGDSYSDGDASSDGDGSLDSYELPCDPIGIGTIPDESVDGEPGVSGGSEGSGRRDGGETGDGDLPVCELPVIMNDGIYEAVSTGSGPVRRGGANRKRSHRRRQRQRNRRG